MDIVLEKDPIEELICESIRLGETAMKMRLAGFTNSDDAKKIKQLEEESEVLWQQAKQLGRAGVQRSNYEDLANAIIHSAVEDYEELICGSRSEGTHGVSKNAIEAFLREQEWVKLDMEDILEHIRDVYENQFLPYATKHAMEITKQWDDFDKKRLETDYRVRITKHRCPLCGGSLRPMGKGNHFNIGCTGCKLQAYLPGHKTRHAV